jgi:hypothetical protein
VNSVRSPELFIQSFLIKIWLEETTDEEGEVLWRGRITHVPGGERRFFDNLNDIARFIKPYLGELNDDSDNRSSSASMASGSNT